jgi:hypothetical protein
MSALIMLMNTIIAMIITMENWQVGRSFFQNGTGGGVKCNGMTGKT